MGSVTAISAADTSHDAVTASGGELRRAGVSLLRPGDPRRGKDDRPLVNHARRAHPPRTTAQLDDSASWRVDSERVAPETTSDAALYVAYMTCPKL